MAQVKMFSLCSPSLILLHSLPLFLFSSFR